MTSILSKQFLMCLGAFASTSAEYDML